MATLGLHRVSEFENMSENLNSVTTKSNFFMSWTRLMPNVLAHESRPALILLNNKSNEKCLHLLVKKSACFLYTIKRGLLFVKCNKRIVSECTAVS